MDGLYMLLMLIGLPLVFIPQWLVKRTYERYARVPAENGMCGAEVARNILHQNGVLNVSVEAVDGVLSDHYDPTSRTVRLSTENFHGASVAAVAVAAHECGHALQHAHGFFPVVLRSAMVPAVNLGSQLGPILIMISLVLMGMRVLGPELAMLGAWVGVILFAAAVAFHMVTLPVEIDASMRAIRVLSNGGYLQSVEVPMARSVLTAAAFTYVATALYALMQLGYFILQVMGASRRSN